MSSKGARAGGHLAFHGPLRPAIVSWTPIPILMDRSRTRTRSRKMNCRTTRTVWVFAGVVKAAISILSSIKRLKMTWTSLVLGWRELTLRKTQLMGIRLRMAR